MEADNKNVEYLLKEKEKLIGFDTHSYAEMKSAVERDPFNIRFLTEDLLFEYGIFKEISGFVFNDIDESKTADCIYELFMMAVKENGYTIKYLNYIDFDICIEAVNQNGTSLQYIILAEELFSSSDIMEIEKTAVHQNAEALQYCVIFNNDLIKVAFEKDITSLRYLSNIFIEGNDVDIIKIYNEYKAK